MSRIYRSLQDDAFDSIAYRLFGDENLCVELMAANPDKMDVLLFGPGEEIEIPDLVVPPKEANDLPPWYEE